MLAPTFDPQQIAKYGLPLLVLVSSLLGSSHCIAMCGGIVISATKSRATYFGYHLGRLLGYLSLGLTAGLLGSILFVDFKGSKIQLIASWVSVAVMVILLLVNAYDIWKQKPSTSSRWLGKLLNTKKSSLNNSLAIGFITAFLPCGWLYSYVLVALATSSAASGGFVLFFFWLGTVPALSSVHIIWPMISKKLRPIFLSVILVCAAATTLGQKIVPLITHKPATHCHFH
ncbi:MAG: sulfite exporter TauE/SafE family protein [Bacteriovoracia bacterium]